MPIVGGSSIKASVENNYVMVGMFDWRNSPEFKSII